MVNPADLKEKLQKLIVKNQQDLNNIKKIALDQAWKTLQLATAETVQAIQNNYPALAGKDKKELAMTFLSTFYDSVFTTVTVPLVPGFLQPIINRYIKAILMIMVSSSIDAIVQIFKQTGVFSKEGVING